ncbi:sn-glycerol-1-phosphate dehydrogenase [Pelosinus sp. sgz500959]|uniref:sn-glycerol-1-phosphate dehydrogenase n=1 Tax=Pelosinus sp. sgz500959 TaxID=3242472 RepID=UPI00366FACF1
MNELLTKTPEEMAGLNFPCSCGKTHSIDIKDVRIGTHILTDLIDSLQPFRKGTLLLIADCNTYEAAGRQVESILSKDFQLKKVIFSNPHLHPDEIPLEQLRAEMNSDITAIVVVGSGTLNDLARYLSYETKIPYVVVGTAPSMDGYASMVSPLITKGVKVTYNAVYPYCIIADLSIMKEAPFHMIHAGLGDIVGKYSALADWKLANILHEEYYCTATAELVEKAIEQCVSSASGILTRSPESICSIIEGLILSGMCIGMTGSSRPASGEEHLLSHAWEMLGLIRGQETHLHGNQVGIGTEIILHVYQYLLHMDIHKIYNEGKFRSFNREKWENNITQLFGHVAPEMIQKKAPYLNFTESAREKAAQHIVEKWEHMKESVFITMPTPTAYRQMMDRAGSHLGPLDLKLDRESFRLSLLTAKEVRQRFGVMQMLEDLGLLEEVVDMITDIYYS